MAFILLLFSRIANTPRAVAPIPKMVMIVMTAHPVQSTLEAATRRNSTVFIAYIALLVMTAILIAFFTWLTWDAGNRVQTAVQDEANARIEEAKQKAAEAERSAGDANRRAGEIEQSNLTLRGQVATLETNAATANKDLAGLQKLAADAKAEQQRVQIELAKQQEKTATAQRELAKLKETLRPRHLTNEQVTDLIELLSGDPKGPVDIECVLGDGEGNNFATQIDSAFKAAGWTVNGGGVSQGASWNGGDPVGFGIAVRSAISAPSYATRIQRAFFAVGIPAAGLESPDLPEGTVRIIVGHKPIPAN